jgi:hypothetical protein
VSDRWLDAAHAAAYVGYADALSFDTTLQRRAVKAFRMWATRWSVPCGHRGRRIVFLPADLDRALGAVRRAETTLRRAV